MRLFLARVVLIFVGLAMPVCGEEQLATTPGAGRYEAFFTKGKWEGMAGGAGFFSPVIATGGRPHLNYAVAVGQVGRMLTEPRSHGWWRGNFEAVGEVFGGEIYEGHGSYVTGLTVWGRYNVVPSLWRVAPYAQVGMGLGFADKDRNVFGTLFGFNMEAGAGARCFLTPRLALQAEYRFQHISNANTAPHNLGINAHGPMVGLAWAF